MHDGSTGALGVIWGAVRRNQAQNVKYEARSVKSLHTEMLFPGSNESESALQLHEHKVSTHFEKPIKKGEGERETNKSSIVGD